jgi:hypothetical protein
MKMSSKPPVSEEALWRAFPDRFIREEDWWEPVDVPAGGGLDVFASGSAHDAAMWALVDTSVRMNELVAAEYAAIDGIVREARVCPEPWVGPDPTVDPQWVDPRDRSVTQVRADRRELAARAVIAEIAVRLRLSEYLVRARASYADVLQQRCPAVWAAFRAGQVAERNAVTAAQVALQLSKDAPEVWARFDELVAGSAQRLSPGAFRVRARVVRERVHPESVQDRHDRAAKDRDVWFQAEADGMGTVTAFMPVARAKAVFGRVDTMSRHLRDQPGEERTLPQVRADVLADLMLTAQLPSGGPETTPAVAVTIPVMTLLGRSDEPAVLDGYGPIDLETARHLAGSATSWVRILTHPVTGTVLDVDRKTYRVPKALRRWLGVRDPVCIFPGCTRSARDCQIDHRIEWQYGGATSADNTAPLCEPHHVLKTETRWRLYRDHDTGATWWITPTAHEVEPDPPPW